MPYRHLGIYGAFCGVNIPIRAGVIPSVLPRPSLRRDFGMSIRAVSELGDSRSTLRSVGNDGSTDFVGNDGWMGGVGMTEQK